MTMAAVTAARYAPEGSRSYGPTRVEPVEGPDYFEEANSQVTLIPMIETVAAMDAIDGILSVDGLKTGEQICITALDAVVAACERHGVVPGIHTTPATAPDRIQRGFRMMTVSTDLGAVRTKTAADLELIRGVGGAQDDSIY